MGLKDSAYYHLEKAVAGPIHWGMSDFLERDPLFENIRDESKFQQMVGVAKEKVRLKREEVRKLERSGEIPTSLDQIELYWEIKFELEFWKNSFYNNNRLGKSGSKKETVWILHTVCSKLKLLFVDWSIQLSNHFVRDFKAIADFTYLIPIMEERDSASFEEHTK